MSHPSFWPAYRIVPIILAAYAFDAFTNYMKFGILLQKRTILLAYGNLLSALVITGGYLILIPRMGVMGAAVATFCAYFFRFLWITYESQKLFRIIIPFKQITYILIFCLLAYVISILGPEELFMSILFNLLISIFFIAMIIVFPILPDRWRKVLLTLIMNPKKMTVYFHSSKS